MCELSGTVPRMAGALMIRDILYALGWVTLMVVVVALSLYIGGVGR